MPLPDPSSRPAAAPLAPPDRLPNGDGAPGAAPIAHAGVPVSIPDPGDEDGAPRGLSAWPVVWAVALGLVVTAIVSFVTGFDIGDLRLFVDRLHVGWLAAAVSMLGLRIVFGGWRLTVVSSGRLTLAHGLRGQLAWDFFSNVTPAAIGGGPFTAAYVARDRGIPLGEGVAILLFAMLIEQFWTLASTLFILAMLLGGVPVLPNEVGTWGKTLLGGYAAVMAVWTAVMTTALLWRPGWITRAVEGVATWPLVRRRADRIRTEGRHLAERASVLRGHGAGFYVKGFVLASLAWICRYQMLVFLVWAVDPSANGPLVFLRYMALMLGTMVLPTPGGAGGAEGLFALCIGPLITPAALVTPLLIVWRGLAFYLFLLIGLPLALRTGGAAPGQAEASTPEPSSSSDSSVAAS